MAGICTDGLIPYRSPGLKRLLFGHRHPLALRFHRCGIKFAMLCVQVSPAFDD